ncbi:MAG TPA: hypothetical protein PKY30_22195, partial [Myxococcota bacterium]|nr:hypothetical protein [Myxococcota bacterium]
LSSVGGDVSSLNHSCAGLSALQSIGGQLYLSRDNGAGVTSLQSLGGLYASGVDPTAINVTTISGGVTLMDAPAMTSLNQVTSIGGSILVDGNIYSGAPLSSITGFQGLRTVGGGISMYHVDSLTSITGMSSLQSVAGELYIYAWYVNNLSGFSQVQSLGGLRLLGTRLSNLNSFSNLRTINGDLDIQAAYLLSDATGLHGVRSVTGNLTFATNGLSGAQVNTLIQTIGTANIGGIITNND